MLRHIVITILYLLYPVFVIRVAYDGTWLYALELKALVCGLDLALYALINWGVWRHRPDVAATAKTVALYPFYRMFLRCAYVVGHWRCVTLYAPGVPMRTGQYTGAATPVAGLTYGRLPDWVWQRLLFTAPGARRARAAAARSARGAKRAAPHNADFAPASAGKLDEPLLV